MKAIILAAGKGERLLPLTKDNPKCMVKLFNKTILERQIEIFRNCGINEIIVITGYLSERINICNLKYYQNKKYDSTNMLETLFCAKKELHDDIIISYGDIIFEKKILEQLLNSKDDISIIVDKNWEEYWKIRSTNPLEDTESLKLDKNGYITSIGQKVSNLKEVEGQYIGLMKFQNKGPKIICDFYEKCKKESTLSNPLHATLPFEKSFMTDFLYGLIKENVKLKAIFIHNGWLELDTLNDYNVYNKLYQKKLLHFYKP